ncbi:MAG: hypothetical protein ABW215_20570 [Kibdelosporangium sp.]
MPRLVDLYDSFLLDLDGLADAELPAVAETFDALESMVFLTRMAVAEPRTEPAHARTDYPSLLRAALDRGTSSYPIVISRSMECVAAARRLGIPSVLLVGAVGHRELSASQDERPTYLANDLGDLWSQQPTVDIW